MEEFTELFLSRYLFIKKFYWFSRQNKLKSDVFLRAHPEPITNQFEITTNVSTFYCK